MFKVKVNIGLGGVSRKQGPSFDDCMWSNILYCGSKYPLVELEHPFRILIIVTLCL